MIDDLGRSTISVLDAEPIYVGCALRTLPLHRNNNLDDVSAIVSLATQIASETLALHNSEVLSRLKNPVSWVGVRKFCKYKSSCFTSECYNDDLINLFSRYQHFSI